MDGFELDFFLFGRGKWKEKKKSCQDVSPLVKEVESAHHLMQR
jgi:hypothetical protein